MRARILFTACLLVAVCVAAEAFGCPNCKDGIAANDPEGMGLARGYFYSILLMLAMPFTLVGSFGAYVWREMRRQQRQEAGGGEAASRPGAAPSAPQP